MGKLIDLSGQRFGNWGVLKFMGNRYWLCECDCGTLKHVHAYNLRSGRSKSCGCLTGNKFIDMTDKRFGKWEVLEYLGDELWSAKCDCGTVKPVCGYYLRNGRSESCGCFDPKKLVGQRFNRLVVVEYAGNGEWLCICDCGNTTKVKSGRLLSGHTSSCGCFARGESHRKYKHGLYIKTNNNTELPCSIVDCSRVQYANGHCRVHLGTLVRRDKMKYLIKISGGKCKHCGGIFPHPVYDFHHRNPKEKEFAIGDGITSLPLEKVIEESKKCDLLCQNCHYIEQVEQSYREIEDALVKLEKIRSDQLKNRMQYLTRCKFPDCDRQVAGLGYCSAHRRQYLRNRKNNDLLKPIRTKREHCKYRGCSRPRHAKGLCSFHYQRLRTGSHLGAPISLKGVIDNCLVEGCSNKPRGNGLCYPHWRKHSVMKKYSELVEIHGDKCKHCRKAYLSFVYQFHHKDPSQKSFQISSKLFSLPLREIIKESLKCDMVCANCHRILHFESDEVPTRQIGGSAFTNLEEYL